MANALLIANDFPPVTSGIATAFAGIWRHLPAESTAVVAPDLPGANEYDGAYPVRVRRVWLPLSESVAAKALKTILTVGRMVGLCLRERPTRFHCGQVLSSGIGGLFCRQLFGVPYTVWVYGSETVRLGRGPLGRALMKRVLAGCRWVVANSDRTSAEFEAFGVSRDRIRRVYPGVDPHRYRPMAPDPALAGRLGVLGRRVLLTVARLDQRKGHDVVLQALAGLGRDDLVYLIAGTGREEGRLRDLAARLGLGDRVRFLGFVPDGDLAALYNLCDVFVMPNRVTEGTALEGDIEGFGITFLEAGACGRPVVAGRSGGAVEAVLDEVTGILVDPRDVAAVAAAVSRLLDDPRLARRMGRAARDRMVREFDWGVLARQVEAIL